MIRTLLSKSNMRTAFLIVAFFPLLAFAQKTEKQLSFCGSHYKNKEKLIKNLQLQHTFLQLNENDTIADIGAASGWFEGALSVVSPHQNITFYLVDIDSNCLNERMVNNMKTHYQALKGSPITNRFIPVLNREDSLFLPLSFFPKVWLINILHEINDKPKMVNDVHKVLRSGGEVIVLELSGKKEGQKHGGCKKPLISIEEIISIFSAEGLTYKEQMIVERKKNFDVVMLRFVKN